MKPSAIAQLREKASYHAQRAQALFIAIEELEGVVVEKKTGRKQAFLEGAIAEHATMNGHRRPLLLEAGAPKPKKKQTGEWKARKMVKYARVAAFLDGFSETVPSPGGPEARRQGLNGLAAHGFLRNVGNGMYLRTTKPYTKHLDGAAPADAPAVVMEPKEPSTKLYRIRVQRVLGRFNQTEPREFTTTALPSNIFSLLTRQGYLTKTAKGYLRTEKVYSLAPEKK